MTRRARILRACWMAPIAAAIALAPAAARADDDTSELEGLLNENVVSTASKSAEVATAAPATATTITAEDLQRYGIRTLAEAIDFLSLGAVTSDSQHNVDVGARGVMIPNDNSDHILLLINGHAVNEPLFGAARFGRGAAIPIEMIDHIEVILGPGSVLYGSNAMLGVINVITKRAKDWSGVHVGGELEPQRSWRVTGGAGTTFKLPVLKSPSEVTFGLEYFQHDGPPLLYDLQYFGVDPVTSKPYRLRRGGEENGYWGGVARNGYYSRLPAGFLRLVLGDVEINFQINRYKRATPYRARYTKAFMDFDDPDSFENERRLWVDVTHRATLSTAFRLTSRVYLDGWDWASDVNTSEASACLAAGDSTVPTCTFAARGRSRWAGAELRGNIDWLENDRLVTTLGVDGRLREAGFKIDYVEFGTGRALQSSDALISREDEVLAAYLQQTAVPWRWLSLNAGARVDKERRFDPLISPRFAAALNTWRGGTWKAIYAEAFRAPSFIESDLAQAIQIHAGALVPERVRSVEGSFEQKLGAQRVIFGVFRSRWTNMVENHILTDPEQQDAVRQGLIGIGQFGVAQFRNVSAIENYGFNGGLEGALGGERQLRYGVNLTGAVAMRDEPGAARVPLTVAPQLFGNARLAYDLPDAWPTISVAAHYLKKRPVDRAYDGAWLGGVIAPPQLELRGAITGPLPPLKGLSYRLTATYAFADRGPYVVGPAQVRDEWTSRPQLIPIDQFRTTIGLQYDLLP